MDPDLTSQNEKLTELSASSSTTSCGYHTQEAPQSLPKQSGHLAREDKQRARTRLDDMSPYKCRERAKEISYKRPSELRSRRTPKGTVLRFDDLDDGPMEEGSDEEKTPSVDSSVVNSTRGSTREEGVVDRGITIHVNTSKIAREVSIESLIVNKRKGKTKALMDEYDFLPKPGSKAIITLEDEDQEFIDSWTPDFYVEPVFEVRYPLYSDVVRTGSLTPDHSTAS
ncbi:hypothetical protein FRC17_000086 [Serendipita sp. 399]|nr:hypothetical protein FRC17_000086 [Serendipita sp. 399]